MSGKHVVEIDNQDVRVTRWTLQPGEETGPHLHEHKYVVVPLTSAVMAITTPDGAHNSASLTPGKAYFREAGAQHVARNDGDDVLDFVEVEIVGTRTEATEKDK